MTLTSEPYYQPVQDSDIASDTEGDVQPEPLLIDVQTRWAFFFLGCAMLLPWNVIITPVPFFLSRLEDAPHLKLTFSSYLTTVQTIVGFVFLAHATFRAKPTSPSRVTRTMILTLAALTSLLALSTLIRIPAGFFAALVLLNAGAQSTCVAYLQKAIFAAGSLFGPPALQPIMSGQAAVAVVISAVQVFSAAISLWGLPRDIIATYVSDGSVEGRSALMFFSLSTIFLLFCLLVHGWLVRTPLYKSVVGALENKQLYSGSFGEESGDLVSGEGSDILRDQSRIIDLAKENIIYQFAVAYVFIITLSVFPPITTSILPTNPEIHPLLFSSIHFLVFNMGDFLGRYICSFPRLLIWSGKRLLVLSLLRTAFVPLFLMCNVQQSLNFTRTPIINSDALYMFILLMFGISNGYLGSMCMISAPSLEHNPRLRGREDVDIVAIITNFSLVGGLVIGSAASFGVKAAVCNCNPFVG
ncbi:hypothetical protein AX15_002526 [Amanita polypyramis BW_CC]|nr:hypothetical protein AX15_002526 [Amanita polypyramis BW_CC]